MLEKGLDEMRQREREVSSGIANRTGSPEDPGVAVSVEAAQRGRLRPVCVRLAGPGAKHRLAGLSTPGSPASGQTAAGQTASVLRWT